MVRGACRTPRPSVPQCEIPLRGATRWHTLQSVNEVFLLTVFRSELPRSELPRSELSRSDLFRSELSRSELPRSELSRSDLFRSELSRSELSRSDLFRSELSRSELSHHGMVPLAKTLRKQPLAVHSTVSVHRTAIQLYCPPPDTRLDVCTQRHLEKKIFFL
jgi:hypothetical protein